METSRAAVMAIGANLIAVWIAAAAGGRAVPQVPAGSTPRLSQEQAVGQAQGSLAAATERLRMHSRQTTDVPAVTRDPFHFGGQRSAARQAAAGPDAAAVTTARPPAAEPARPELVLQGMAEDQAGGAIVRTAILSAGGDLVLATLGTQIGGRYSVVAIDADSVELDDAAGGPRITLRLK